ncbi:hypothetical protein [Chitinophaga sp. Cy-1792]|uniref:hypothetical protein n=1 Tax=Chitinophaga sp. Cy-1792 TaxID=2608339 RepID=UPI00141E379E|nr:hypothetical protein [Chitinophaga sp. Cy-1792]NIG55923.1 hypothetical protein [Chitinophaga sp. Cy-1792]
MIIIAFLFPATLQATGLVFNSYDQVQEKRTSLVLTSGTPICLEDKASLSFDFNFFPDRQVYYGYLVRLVNQHGQNIDLIYNDEHQQVAVVSGNTYTSLAFSLDGATRFHKWNTCTLEFNRHSLTLYINGRPCGTAVMQLADQCFSVVFGACHLVHFKTNDVPPMTLRNIAVRQHGQLQYYWPLNELSGTVATDSIANATATVVNPVWAIPLHQHWKLLQAMHVNGNGSYTFDPAAEELYVVGRDSIYRFLVRDHSVNKEALATPVYLSPGYQAAFNPLDKTLYSVHVDQHELAAWQPGKNQWSAPFDSAGLTRYWQTAKFTRYVDNSLYVIGGYGQLTYKKEIQRFSFTNGKWENIVIPGSDLKPRYLAAAGTTPGGDTAYILGGYGSDNGEQMLTPQYFYELLRFDVKYGTLKRVYNFHEPEEPVVFGSSMVISPADSSFYALAFPNDRFQSRLQLMKGSLTVPGFTALADTIPYAFLDNRSSADLFYCARTHQLLAVTQIVDKDKSTEVKIYSLAFPPEKLTAMATSFGKSSAEGWPLWLIVLGIMAGDGILVYIFLHKKRKTKKTETPEQAQPVVESPGIPQITSVVERIPLVPAVKKEPKATFRLFGEFHVVDKDGNVLTHLFSPLLKEMFLLIAIHTIWSGKGVSTEKLYEILWADKPDRDARNNRSVNMVKLKTIFEKIGLLSVVKEENRWKLNYEESSVEIDLHVFTTLINLPQLQQPELLALINIVQEGTFLFRTDYFWLEDLKSAISTKALDVLQLQLQQLLITATPELIIETANAILILDPLHEGALQAKCAALIKQGRPSLARAAFEKFCKDYAHMYGEKFPVSFQDIIS